MKGWTRWLGLLLLAAAGALIVYLVRQNQRLADRYTELRERTRRPYAGYYVPIFRAPTLSGDTATVGRVPDSHRQVLFYFNTTCPHCRASLPAWKRIAREARADSTVRVVGLSTQPLDSVRPYRREHGLEFPVSTFPGPRELALYRADIVPITVVVGPGGLVLYGRGGRLESPAAVDSVLTVAFADLTTPDAQEE